MTGMPPLETRRLIVRPFLRSDLEAVHQLLDVDLAEASTSVVGSSALDRAARKEWLEWTVLNYGQLDWLHQPPYGDRAVVLKETGRLIGSAGYVPLLDVYSLLPYFASLVAEPAGRFASTEFGLYYAIDPAYQRQGYASEAARALVDYAFHSLRLGRVIATTSYDNLGSMAVMRRLGMRIERNPSPDPPWLQVVGVLENPG